MQEVEQLQKPRAQSFNAIKDSLNEELLKGIPLREQEQVEIEQEAVRILEEVRKIDVYSEDFTAKTALSDRLKEILDIAGTRKQQVIDINSAFTKRNFQGMEDSAAKTAIDELKDVLIEYDPSKFNLTEPDRILNFIPLPDSVGKKIKAYFRKFKEAETHLNDIIQGVIAARDDGVRSLEELTNFQIKLVKLGKDLKKQYCVLKLVAQKTEEYLEELKESDPEKAKRVEQDLMKTVIFQLRDTLEIISTSKLGVSQTDLLIETQKDLVEMTDRLANNGRLILTIGQNVAISLYEQNKSREMVEGVQEALNTLTKGTSEGLKNHVAKLKEMSNKNIASTPEVMTEAFKETFACLDQMKELRSQAIEKAKQSVAAMETANAQVDKELSNRQESAQAYTETLTSVTDKITASRNQKPEAPKNITSL